MFKVGDVVKHNYKNEAGRTYSDTYGKEGVIVGFTNINDCAKDNSHFSNEVKYPDGTTIWFADEWLTKVFGIGDEVLVPVLNKVGKITNYFPDSQVFQVIFSDGLWVCRKADGLTKVEKPMFKSNEYVLFVGDGPYKNTVAKLSSAHSNQQGKWFLNYYDGVVGMADVNQLKKITEPLFKVGEKVEILQGGGTMSRYKTTAALVLERVVVNPDNFVQGYEWKLHRFNGTVGWYNTVDLRTLEAGRPDKKKKMSELETVVAKMVLSDLYNRSTDLVNTKSVELGNIANKLTVVATELHNYLQENKYETEG